MTHALLRSIFLSSLLVVGVACSSDGFRGPRPPADSGAGGDSAMGGDGAIGGDSATGTDGSTGGDSATGTDGSLVGDGGSSTPGGQCDPGCLETPGAVCCTACGICNDVAARCEPQCPDGTSWDCELSCCFNSSSFTCLGE